MVLVAVAGPHIEGRAQDERVVAGAAGQTVGSVKTVQRVVASATVQRVVQSTASEPIV